MTGWYLNGKAPYADLKLEQRFDLRVRRHHFDRLTKGFAMFEHIEPQPLPTEFRCRCLP